MLKLSHTRNAQQGLAKCGALVAVTPAKGGESTMRFTCFAFALILLTVPVVAQDKKDAAPQSPTTVLINGQLIKGKVLDIDGKHFVAVEDLAQSLRGTIGYGDGQIALTLPQLPSTTAQPPSPQPPSATAQPPSSQPLPAAAQPPSPQPPPAAAQQPSPQPPSAAAQPPENGRVKGTLTYFFDFHVGTKPDTGSKVWLVKGRAEIPANQIFIGSSTALGTSGNPEQYNAIKYSIADENGNFELLDVPTGQYTLVMQSAHTKGTLNEKKWNFFGRGNGRNPRDSNGRIEFLNLLIKAGETADASKDFGPNIDM
jgi:hypothetical protein